MNSITDQCEGLKKDHCFAPWVPESLKACWYYFSFNHQSHSNELTITNEIVSSIETKRVIDTVQKYARKDQEESVMLELVFTLHEVLNNWPQFKTDVYSGKRYSKWRADVKEVAETLSALLKNSIYDSYFTIEKDKWFFDPGERKEQLLLSEALKLVANRNEDVLYRFTGERSPRPRPVRRRKNPEKDHSEAFVIRLTEFFKRHANRPCQNEVLILTQVFFRDLNFNEVRQIRDIVTLHNTRT